MGSFKYTPKVMATSASLKPLEISSIAYMKIKTTDEATAVNDYQPYNNCIYIQRLYMQKGLHLTHVLDF